MVKSVSAQYNDVPGASRSYPTPPPATEGGTTSRDVELPRVGASKGEGEALYPLAPEDFWEPEIPPYEDRSAFLDPLSTPETGTRTDGADAKHMAATLTVELVRPTRVMLELTKTSMGIWQHGRGGTRTKMETHTYVAITSTVRSREERPLQQEHRFQPSSSTRDQPMQIEEANAAPLPRFTYCLRKPHRLIPSPSCLSAPHSECETDRGIHPPRKSWLLTCLDPPRDKDRSSSTAMGQSHCRVRPRAVLTGTGGRSMCMSFSRPRTGVGHREDRWIFDLRV